MASNFSIAFTLKAQNDADNIYMPDATLTQ